MKLMNDIEKNLLDLAETTKKRSTFFLKKKQIFCLESR